MQTTERPSDGGRETSPEREYEWHYCQGSFEKAGTWVWAAEWVGTEGAERRRIEEAKDSGMPARRASQRIVGVGDEKWVE